MCPALEVEGEPLLHPTHLGPMGEVEEEGEVEGEGRGQDRVTAEEVDLDLHRGVHPPVDIEVVPALLIVTTGWVVVDPDLVVDIAAELWVELLLEDMLEEAELRLLHRLLGIWIIE